MRDRSAGTWSLVTVAALAVAGWLAGHAVTLATYAALRPGDAAADALLDDAANRLPAALATAVAVAAVATTAMVVSAGPRSARDAAGPGPARAGWAVLGPLVFVLVEYVEYSATWHMAPPSALLGTGVLVHACAGAALSRAARTWVRWARGLTVSTPVASGPRPAPTRVLGGVGGAAPRWSGWSVPHRRGPP